MSQNFDYLADTYGLTVVVSAGNTGPATSSVNTPGIAYNVLTVAAMIPKARPTGAMTQWRGIAAVDRR